MELLARLLTAKMETIGIMFARNPISKMPLPNEPLNSLKLMKSNNPNIINEKGKMKLLKIWVRIILNPGLFLLASETDRKSPK